MIVSGAPACRRHPETHTDSPLVASMDDSTLTLDRVLHAVPQGLSATDSAALADQFIRGWLEDRLFEAYLSIDAEEQMRIERLTEEYRRKLRLDAYRRRIRREHMVPVSPDSIRAYFETHSPGLITEQPLVKGLLLSVPAGTAGLPEIRRHAADGTAQDLEYLENLPPDQIISMEYFGEQWVDFDDIQARIPYRFGNPDTFLEKNTDLYAEHGDAVYLLHIYAWLPTGARMPYSYAESQIADILQESRIEAYRRGLIKVLRSKAQRENRLKTPLYPPDSQ